MLLSGLQLLMWETSYQFIPYNSVWCNICSWMKRSAIPLAIRLVLWKIWQWLTKFNIVNYESYFVKLMGQHYSPESHSQYASALFQITQNRKTNPFLTHKMVATIFLTEYDCLNSAFTDGGVSGLTAPLTFVYEIQVSSSEQGGWKIILSHFNGTEKIIKLWVIHFCCVQWLNTVGTHLVYSFWA